MATGFPRALVPNCRRVPRTPYRRMQFLLADPLFLFMIHFMCETLITRVLGSLKNGHAG